MDNNILQQIDSCLSTSDSFGFRDYSIIQAEKDFKQWKRLSKAKPHPMEQGYSRRMAIKKSIEEVYQIIEENIALCLTSSNPYLRTFASFASENKTNLNAVL